MSSSCTPLEPGAHAKVLLKFLHPSALVAERFPNFPRTTWVYNLTIVRSDELVVSRRRQSVYVCTSPDFTNEDGSLIEVHAVKRWVHAAHPAESNKTLDDENENTPNGMPLPNLPAVLDELTLAEMNGAGFDVDDDNHPAPENVPAANPSQNEDVFTEWTTPAICPFLASNPDHHPNVKGRFASGRKKTESA